MAKVFNATVQSGKVSGTNSNFPAYVDLSKLPADFWDTVSNGGGDIRVYTDSGLTTEIAREVVSCNTSTDKGELWCKVGSMTSSTELYIKVDGTSSDYAVDATYGAQNTWNSDYVGVYHFKQDPTGSETVKDSTSRGNHFNSYNMDSGNRVAGKIGDCYNFNGTDEYLDHSSPSTDFRFTTNMTLGVWVNADVLEYWQQVLTRQHGTGGGDSYLIGFSGTDYAIYGKSWQYNADKTTGTWYNLTFTKDSATEKQFLNGERVNQTTTAETTLDNDDNATTIGAQENGTPGVTEYFNGKIGEIHISKITRS